MASRPWAAAAIALVLGAIATLGFAPHGQWYLTVISLALLFGLAARATRGRALLIGGLFGLGHFLTGVYWIYISTHVYGGAPQWLGALLTLALSAYLAAYPALALWLAARLDLLRAPSGWAAVPALWVLLELARASLLWDGMPWLSLGEIAVDTPLARLLPIAGVHGVSWVVALAAYALYRFAVEPARASRVVAALVLLAPLASFALPRPSSWTQPAGEAIEVALVQANIRQDEKWLPAMRAEALSRHWRLTQQAWPAALVVWPEVALTQPLHQLRDSYLADLDREAAEHQATVLAGLLVIEDKAHYNSVIALGASQGRYDKRHLVPFGEYFPIPAFLRPIMDVLDTPYSDFAFGADDQPLLTAAGHALETSICFEDVFGDEIRVRARESAFLVNMTNDAWFADSAAPHQHLAFSRLRAMENGRWMLRAANTGISALIDADGNLVQRARQFEMEVVRGAAEPRTGWTPYQRWGNAPLWALGWVATAGAVLWRRRNTAKPARP
ncbi:MAG TPA: apolipoprotein N-acyltransferase [Verrucomicrobiae bacterium]|nr:apolipoprotein N-acyltransferase [Verrucomicrobiae bacterium]